MSLLVQLNRVARDGKRSWHRGNGAVESEVWLDLLWVRRSMWDLKRLCILGCGLDNRQLAQVHLVGALEFVGMMSS